MKKLLRKTEGFTLVELIVVIAIMGILAGVGTVGYNGYIKSAQKKADQTLMSNVVRAIEVGNASYAHQLKEVLQPGEEGIQIPIGFIVVSEDGIAGQDEVYTQVYESATRREMITTSICRMEPIQFYKATKIGERTINLGCNSTETKDIYSVEADGDPVDICITHSKSSLKQKEWRTDTNADGTEWIKSGKRYVKDGSTWYEATGEHAPGTNQEGFEEEIYAPGQFNAADDGVLHNIMVDTFGAAYPYELKLSSSNWTEPTLPTFYSSAVDMWGSVKELATSLHTWSGGDASSTLGTTGHDSAADLVYDFANEVAGNGDSGVEMTEEKFMAYWKNVGTRDNSVPEASSYGGYSFGFGLREDYSAARKAYNACFASYVKVTPASVPHANYSDNSAGTHANAIQEYGEWAVVATFPQLVCQDAFDNDDRLKVKNCPACQELYKKYVSSGAEAENGKTFYDTMVTVANTDERVVKGVLDSEGDEFSFFDYYDSYLHEFNGLYSSVYDEVQDGSCVAVCVYLKDGELSYRVSPDDAYQVN